MSDLSKKLNAMNADQLKKLAAAAGIQLDSTPTKAEARAALDKLEPADVEAAILLLEGDGQESDAGKLRKWQVSLKHMPTHFVDAVDREDAVAKYKQHMGVISSEHPFDAAPFEAAADA
jgi:hypothetical protein